MFLLRKIINVQHIDGGSKLSIIWEDGDSNTINLEDINLESEGYPLGKDAKIFSAELIQPESSIFINNRGTLLTSSLYSMIEGKELSYTQFGMWDFTNLTFQSCQDPLQRVIQVPDFFDHKSLGNNHDPIVLTVWYAVESALSAYHKLNLFSPLYEAVEVCKRYRINIPSKLQTAIQEKIIRYHQGLVSPEEDRKHYATYCDAFMSWKAVWAEQFSGKAVQASLWGKYSKDFDTFIKNFKKLENKHFIHVPKDLDEDRMLNVDADAAASRAANTKQLSGKPSTARKNFTQFQKQHSLTGWVYVPNPSLLLHLNTAGKKNEHPLSGAFGRWLPSPCVLAGIPICFKIIRDEIKTNGPRPTRSKQDAIEHIKQLDAYKKKRIVKDWPEEMDLALDIALTLIMGYKNNHLNHKI
ncbi:hypothetical protein [Terasakiella sp.]|uniref:hypothetical protein n=1 Tax=Terasakiella sp. TaxID=2034861 RepID=UPI003AA8B70F